MSSHAVQSRKRKRKPASRFSLWFTIRYNELVADAAEARHQKLIRPPLISAGRELIRLLPDSPYCESVDRFGPCITYEHRCHILEQTVDSYVFKHHTRTLLVAHLPVCIVRKDGTELFPLVELIGSFLAWDLGLKTLA